MRPEHGKESGRKRSRSAIRGLIAVGNPRYHYSTYDRDIGGQVLYYLRSVLSK